MGRDPGSSLLTPPARLGEKSREVRSVPLSGELAPWLPHGPGLFTQECLGISGWEGPWRGSLEAWSR